MNTDSRPTPSTRRVAPHAPLPGYYDAEPRRHRYVVDLFDDKGWRCEYNAEKTRARSK